MGVKYSGFLFNAPDAVSFFFVLSGMVLSYQYLVLGNSLDLRKYFINRFMRLFPAFFIAVLANALWWQRNSFTLPAIYNDFILGENGFWKEALLFKSETKFFGAGWTLVKELTISFFVPFLIVIAKVDRRLLKWFVFTLFVVASMHDKFVFHFTLGIIISAYYHYFVSSELRSKKWFRFRYLIIIAAIVLFSIRRIEELSRFGPDFYSLIQFLQINLFDFTGLAAFIFIICILRSDKLKRLFTTPFLMYMGKISYGIYLIHWLVIDVIYFYWDRLIGYFSSVTVALFVMGLVCFTVSVLLAILIHYAIELPFMKISKRWTSKMKPSVVIK